jgi:hypothetical protein
MKLYIVLEQWLILAAAMLAVLLICRLVYWPYLKWEERKLKSINAKVEELDRLLAELTADDDAKI